MIVCDIRRYDTATRRRVDATNAANDQAVGALDWWTAGERDVGTPSMAADPPAAQVAVPSSSTSATMTAAASALTAWRAMFW